MADFKKFTEEVKASSKSSVYSKSTLQGMVNTLANDPDYVSKRIVPDGENGFSVAESKPGKEFQTGLKKFVSKTYGIDASEADKLDGVTIPKSVTDPMLDVVMDAEVEYLRTGKSLKFPMKSEKQTSMQISIDTVPEKTTATKKIVETAPGKYESVPTGLDVTYKEREAMSVSNKVPAWLKSSKPSKK